MFGRIVSAADFQRVLSMAPKSRSTHFAAHHVPLRPCRPGQRAGAVDQRELSTGRPPSCPPRVDDFGVQDAEPAPSGGLDQAVRPAESGADSGRRASALAWRWLGMVVPKRHARRAVTRNLVKRQIRALWAERGGELAAGMWVIRMKSGFDVGQYPSAASLALRRAVRAELGLLVDRATGLAPAGVAAARPGHGKPARSKPGAGSHGPA